MEQKRHVLAATGRDVFDEGIKNLREEKKQSDGDGDIISLIMQKRQDAKKAKASKNT